MFNVFISASIPELTDAEILDNFNKKELYLNKDRLAIKEALFALLHVLLPCSNIIWGGHPAITSIIYEITRDILHQEKILPHFHLFQSEYFKPDIEEEGHLPSMANYVLVKGVANSRTKSLTYMRQKMLSKRRKIDLAVFIGGKEYGLTEELTILRRNHPETLIIPVASTGGYTRKIFQQLCICEGSEGKEENSENGSIILPKHLYTKCTRHRFYTLFDDVKKLIVQRRNERIKKEKKRKEEKQLLYEQEVNRIRNEIFHHLLQEIGDTKKVGNLHPGKKGSILTNEIREAILKYSNRGERHPQKEDKIKRHSKKNLVNEASINLTKNIAVMRP